jgi:hypothetical protein
MNPSAITTAVQRNSRQQEIAVRDAELALSHTRNQILTLEQRILDQLTTIAAVQLENPAACSSEVTRELDQRQQAEAKLRSELHDLEVSIADLTDMERQLKASLETLNANVNRALAADGEYLRLVDDKMAAAEAAKVFGAARVEIKSECAGKLAGYDQPVFKYLLGAQLGTAEYRSRFVIRRLEHWLAEKSNFHSNLVNYRMLEAMQLGADARYRELRARFEEADRKLQARVDAARAAAGVPSMQGQLDAVQEQLATGKRSANSMHQSLGQFARGKDHHSTRAEQLLLRSLKAQSFEDIQALVAQSSSVRDDTAAGELRFLNRELELRLRQLPALESTLDAAREAYERAKELERTLRDRSYTSSDYRYRSGLDLDALIVGYMAGSISSGRVEAEVRSARESTRRDDDHFGGGFGSSSSGLSDSGSFSSGTSTGGGSFSTGDSF